MVAVKATKKMLPASWKKADSLVVSILGSCFVLLGFGRSWLLWRTGVIVSDEYGYIASAWYGQTENSLLGFRSAFADVNIWIFRLLNLGNIDRVMVAYPFYLSIWTLTTLISVWMLLKLMGFRSSTTALTLSFFAIAPTFVFLSTTFFSEEMALAFASVGLFFLVRSLKHPSLPWGPVSAVISASALWLAMRSREPYSLVFLGASLVVLSRMAWAKNDRSKLFAVAVVFLVFGAYSVLGVQDKVSIEAINSTEAATQGIVVRPLVSALASIFFPGHVGVTSSTSVTVGTTTGGGTNSTSVTVGTTTGGGTNTGSQTQTPTSRTQTTSVGPGLGPPGIGAATSTTTSQTTSAGGSPPGAGGIGQVRTAGFLELLGVKFIPSSAILRVALLLVVSFVTGYGSLVILLGAGALFLAYEMLFGRRFRELIPDSLLTMLFLGTLGGVVLVFADDPNYFGIQHYSTLLRFANTSALMLPILTAPLLERISKARLTRLFLVVFVIALYAGSITLLAQAAVTNLGPDEDPLTLIPPQGGHDVTITLRDFILSHPSKSQSLVLGIGSSVTVWVPGLAGRPDINFSNIMNDSALSRTNVDNLYIYVGPGALDGLRASYGLAWRLVRNGLDGNQTAVGGFRATAVVLDDSSGMIVAFSRA